MPGRKVRTPLTTPHHIDVEGPAPLRRIRIEAAPDPGDRVVDQNRRCAAPDLLDPLARSVKRFQVGDITGQRQGVLADLADRVLQMRPVHVQQCDFQSAGRQSTRERASDAEGGTGDDGDVAGCEGWMGHVRSPFKTRRSTAICSRLA
jgi:hypothetical protein